MASKSKKRRRVLGASCILAALIIAGSSFAWFTSKDEVTNRLTASNDYGVSIVESFTPPANWLPGQTVNKDVYAVNTGNIAAFVKESISGNLTYTYEKREATAPTGTDNNYVKLTNEKVRAIDGVTTNEAGGYLAWSSIDPSDPAYLAPGPIISATNTDYNESQGETPIDNPGKVEGTPWHPTKTGAYVFRRSYVPSTAAVDGRTYTYKIGTEDIDKADLVEGVYRAEKEGTPTTFRYKYSDGTSTYYGTTLDNNAEFYKYNGTDAVSTDVADTLKLTVTTNGSVTPGDAAYYTYAGYYYDADTDTYYKIVLGNDSFRTYKDANNNDVFDVSATQDQIGAGSTLTIDPATGAVTSGAIAYQFVKEETIENATPYLTYYAGNDSEVAKLVAYYSAGDTDESADFLAKQAAADHAAADAQQAYRDYLSAISDEAIAEAEYDNAVGAYNAAVSRYNQALADWTYANALSEASKKLIDAAEDRADAQIAWDNADDDLNKALEAVILEANSLEGTGGTAYTGGAVLTDDIHFNDLININNADTNSTDISYYSIFKNDWSTKGALEDIINGDATSFDYGNIANQSVLTSCQTYMNRMSALWGADGVTGTTGTEATTIVAASNRLKKALEAFDSLTRDDDTAVENCLKELYAARDNLEKLLKDYKALYDYLETVAGSETELTHLIKGTGTDTFPNKIQAWIDRLDDMKDVIEESKSDSQIGKLDIADGGAVQSTPEDTNNDRFGLDAIVQDFVIKYDNFVQEDMVNIPKAEKDWKEAVQAYNAAVDNDTGAGKTYNTAIMTDQRQTDAMHTGVNSKNDYEGLTSDGTTLLNSPAATAEWYLTDNSKALVELFAVERPAATDATYGGVPTLYQYIDKDTGEWKTVGSGTSELNGADLWKKIGATKALPNAETAGKNDSNYYEATPDPDNGTLESVYTPIVTADSSATNTSSYTKAIIAVAKAQNEFNTLVADTKSPEHETAGAYPTVETLKNRITGYKTTADAAKEAYKTAKETTEQKNTDQAAAADVASYAQATADNAADADSSAIKINIYLDDRNDAGHEDLNWTSALGNGESAQVADFYYNYILNAGETSDKLIDAVELDPSVGTKDYKNLVFDLNVALDSVQITYANDQRTITADTATEESFGKKANIVSQTPDDKGIKVTWTPAASYEAPNKVYRVGLTTVTVADEARTVTEGTGATAVTHNYSYKVTVNGQDYYGDSKEDGTTYYATKEGATAGTYVFAEAADLSGKPTTVTLNTVE